MAEVDYSKLTDRELDCAIAERVMGWTHVVPDFYGVDAPAGIPPDNESRFAHHVVPRFTTDDNAARLVRNRVAELALTGPYLTELYAIVSTPNFATEWRVQQATPRQQCEAILTVCSMGGRSDAQAI